MFKEFLLFALLFVAALGVPASEFDDGSWRIVGGSDAEASDAPYQAALRTNRDWQICAAVILNSHTVITAAHCVRGIPIQMINIVTGTLLLTSGGQSYDASATIIHPDFNPGIIFNDIALVITNETIEFSPTVQPIKLSLEPTGAGVSVLLTGWGQTANPGSMAQTLQKITLKTLTYDDCKTKLDKEGTVHDNQICTLTEQGEGACYGDSGGPLAGETGLIGIVSWGAPCAKGFPDVYSRISSFADWINENAQE